jgi:hypothetical protein
MAYNGKATGPDGLTDKVPVSGTDDTGSIPVRGAREKLRESGFFHARPKKLA